jgi:hypothetical protein
MCVAGSNAAHWSKERVGWVRVPGCRSSVFRYGDQQVEEGLKVRRLCSRGRPGLVGEIRTH